MLIQEQAALIFDAISPGLPADWDRVILYEECLPSSYSVEYYVEAAGSTVKCFDLPGAQDEELLSRFARVNDLIMPLRVAEGEPGYWSNITLVWERGSLGVLFDSTDLLESGYEHKKLWANRFLGRSA